MEEKKNNRNFQVFKFSIDADEEPELVAYLRSITPKPARGKWLLSAVKTYRLIERAARYAPHEQILNALQCCLQEKLGDKFND